MKSNFAKYRIITIVIILVSLTFILSVGLIINNYIKDEIGDNCGFIVPEPDIDYPFPVKDNYINQTGRNVDGKIVNIYDPEVNPIIRLLIGFDRIWVLGDVNWSNGGVNSNGPKDFSKVKVLDNKIWTQNMKYVLKVTKNRTDEESLAAYLDDKRAINYSIIDGLGPLADLYKKGAKAKTTINTTLKNFDVNEVIEYEEYDNGTGAGVLDSELGNFVTFMNIMLGTEGTPSPSKYYYSSPRPWRMNDYGDVIQTGVEKIGNKIFELYDSNVEVVPALKYSRNSINEGGRQTDGGFPSGHTDYAYLSAYAFAYAIPERFSELLTRASELGENRIISGMHSPLDVIGGRIIATAIAAAYLNDSNNLNYKESAFKNIHDYFEDKIPEDTFLYEYSQSKDKNGNWSDDDLNKKLYLERMTYGFEKDKSESGKEIVVPKGAEVLLETRLPYLSDKQRRVVLYTTCIDSGYPLLDDTYGWGRLNLVAAAAGYGAFKDDVYVNMAASKGGLHKYDSWDNNITGEGMLVKNGTGSLELTGDNSYSGGTILKNGELIAVSNSSFGKGNLYIKNGVVLIKSKNGLKIEGNYKQLGGKLVINLDKEGKSKLKIDGDAIIKGGILKINANNFILDNEEYIEILSAKSIKGKFEKILIDGYKIESLYTNTSIKIKIRNHQNS